jgi:hypothetical protein
LSQAQPPVLPGTLNIAPLAAFPPLQSHLSSCMLVSVEHHINAPASPIASSPLGNISAPSGLLGCLCCVLCTPPRKPPHHHHLSPAQLACPSEALKVNRLKEHLLHHVKSRPSQAQREKYVTAVGLMEHHVWQARQCADSSVLLQSNNPLELKETTSS